ncbi:hypothetical protein SDC9_164267 [bioreactor metagenome]|uniref:Uncharacterized protein n=1 Tax=bioreactor metagenome TaxID=1076179 RepID=A0A645FTW8_9ZZZZ
MRRPVQTLDTTDADHVGPRPGNPRPHRHQAVRQVDNLRFSCSILDDRLAICQTGRHHEVLGTGHGHHVGKQPGTLETWHPGVDVAMLDRNLGPHRLQPLDVLINRPGADRTSPRQTDTRLATTCHQRAQHEDGRTHGLDHFIRCDRVVQPGRIKHDGIAVTLDSDPHLPQQGKQGADVLEPRNVGKGDGLGTQQRCAQDGQGGILGAGNCNLTIQPATAFDQKLVHMTPLRDQARCGPPPIWRAYRSATAKHGSRCPSACRGFRKQPGADAP